jgi:hypothetical protein
VDYNKLSFQIILLSYYNSQRVDFTKLSVQIILLSYYNSQFFIMPKADSTAQYQYLELGHLYFLLPMHKLHSLISPSEMASLAFKADSALHKSTSNSMSLARILPVFCDLCPSSPARSLAAHDLSEEINGVKETSETEDFVYVPKLQVDDEDDVGQLRGLTRRCKYWKPALETISESPSPVMSFNLSIAPLLRQPKKGNHLAQSFSVNLKETRPVQD